MAIFFTSPQPALPAINTVLRETLSTDPKTLPDIDKAAAQKTIELAQALSPTFNAWRFAGAVLIAIALLLGAIWTGQHNLPDISNALMTSFTGFSGLVLGMLGGEAQKSTAS